MADHTGNFEKFGWKFQNRVISASLNDDKFFQQNVAICKPSYFSSDALQTIWQAIVDYYLKYNVAPSFDSLYVEIAKIEDDNLVNDCKIMLAEVNKETNKKDIKSVKDTVTDFCTEKEIEQAILDSVELLKKNKKDAIKTRIEKALKHVHAVDIGHVYFDRLEERLKQNFRNTVPTGFKLLDGADYLDGGLGVGEIGVIMAPTGGGKSFWLMMLGYGALKNKVNVVHYTFELSEVNIGRRYDACISGIPMKDLTSKSDMVQKALKEFDGGKLVIKEFPTKSANINKIKFHIDRLLSSDFEPGLIIIDYADLMISTKAFEQKTWELEAIYEELRGFGMEIKIPIWSASQTNRLGLDGDIIGLDKIADAYAKAQVADFIATFSRNMVEKEKNKGKFYIAKNRIGVDGKVFGVDFNPATASIVLQEFDEQVKLEGDIQSLYKKYKDNKDGWG